MSATVVLRERGVLTIPKDVRERSQLETGTTFQVIDLGEGTLVLTRQAGTLAEIAAQFSKAFDEEGITLEDLLREAKEERRRLYRERYGR